MSLIKGTGRGRRRCVGRGRRGFRLERACLREWSQPDVVRHWPQLPRRGGGAIGVAAAAPPVPGNGSRDALLGLELLVRVGGADSNGMSAPRDTSASEGVAVGSRGASGVAVASGRSGPLSREAGACTRGTRRRLRWSRNEVRGVRRRGRRRCGLGTGGGCRADRLTGRSRVVGPLRRPAVDCRVTDDLADDVLEQTIGRGGGVDMRRCDTVGGFIGQCGGGRGIPVVASGRRRWLGCTLGDLRWEPSAPAAIGSAGRRSGKRDRTRPPWACRRPLAPGHRWSSGHRGLTRCGCRGAGAPGRAALKRTGAREYRIGASDRRRRSIVDLRPCVRRRATKQTARARPQRRTHRPGVRGSMNRGHRSAAASAGRPTESVVHR